MIDTSSWKKFRVGDLFEFESIKQAKSQRAVPDDINGIPYVVQSKHNNMVARYVNKQWLIDNNEPPVKGNAIALGVTLNCVSYQENEFGASQIITARNNNLNCYIGNFVVTILTYATERFTYKEKPGLQKYKDTIIKLPATSDGQPDWDYMESYMKIVMEESEKNLERLRKADYTKHLIDVSGWGEFDVTKFFTVLSGRTKLSNADIDDGDIPVYSSNSTNGGVFGYTTKSPDYEVNDENPFYITFGDHTKAVNIVNKSFCVMDNVKVLTSNIRNYDVLHFIITSWLRNVPDLGYARHWSEAEKAKIWLPITSTGEPDWQYMEGYMQRIMDKSKQIIADLQIRA